MRQLTQIFWWNVPSLTLHFLILEFRHRHFRLDQFQAQMSVRQEDGWYSTNGKRIKSSLGLLFQLWKLLSDARQSAQDTHGLWQLKTFFINQVLRLIEQTVVCLGQATQSVDLYRCQAILSRCVRTPNMGTDILVSNDICSYSRENRKTSSAVTFTRP